MININGSYAGGQVLRTALALSSITNEPFKMVNIRGLRQKPGLKHQHLECLLAVKKLCNAEVHGAKLGSKEIVFKPSNLISNRVKIRLTTAASVGLVLQCLLISGVEHSLRIKIEGGATYGKWSPPMDFLANIVFPLLKKMDYEVKVLKHKDGFYPKGGALVEVQTTKANLKPVEFLEKGKLVSINGVSVASSNLEKARVAERQAKAARKELFYGFECPIKIKAYYRDALCPGTGITLWAKTENTVVGADSLGVIGKRSETVGKEAARKLVFEYNNGVIDSYTADQLLPYFGLAGRGKLKTSVITEHIKTNTEVVEQFLPVKFAIKDHVVECFAL